jgi:hypothetical protein
MILGLLQSNACVGWRTGPLVLEGLERVYVPYFENDTYFRRLEHDLTHEVISRINERSDLFLTDEKSADLILKGRIIDYRLTVLSEDPQDRVLESAATVTVEVKVVRASDGSVLREAVLRDSAEFNREFNESLETARVESFSVLSRKIVSLMEEGF